MNGSVYRFFPVDLVNPVDQLVPFGHHCRLYQAGHRVLGRQAGHQVLSFPASH